MIRTSVLLKNSTPGVNGDTSTLTGLDPILRRHAINELTVLQQGPETIVHCEASSQQALKNFLDDPEVDTFLHIGGNPMSEEIFVWQEAEWGPSVRSALNLTLQEGKEDQYRAWLADKDVLRRLELCWRRNGVWRHDVLLQGTAVIAYYETETIHGVAKAFREPEALEMLLQELSALLVLDPYVPILTFYATYEWNA
jgi:hypothetical protein